MIDQNQLEREHRYIRYIIATLFGGGAITLLACGGLVFMLVMESGESAPHEAERWFKAIVHNDLSSFTEVQHYTIQGIDYSHHFRFAFTDRSDFDAVIRPHKLTANTNPIRFLPDSLPGWFDPPSSADAFSNGDSDTSIVLWIDDDARVAYFELMKI